MSSQQPDEERIFHIARELAKAEARSEYLDQICAGDQQLRERVDALLEVHEKEAKFLKSSPEAVPTVDHMSITETAGSQIGHFKLLQQIGEGGFGIVYMAEQTKPIRRKVALKVIKPGMDTKEVIARFEAERQALAMMEHPNIAKVYDGGETDSGHPYFVMELVRGVPLTKFCDENKLDTRSRLALFGDVCNALQHAHQKGVIHRDIKPSNVLVTLHDGKPVPKVIDFGVAKAISQHLTAKTLFTAYGQMVGTPQYMSPEQAEMSGLDIDTRSDIYSLGVLLYELLTGSTPLDPVKLRNTAYAELQRMIREDEPLKPSRRLSTLGEQTASIAACRNSDPKRLAVTLHGELDWIVMKALDKDRNRRYDTAKGFALDIERYLADEPVSACPPSTGYLLRKAFHRYRQPAIVGLILVFLMLVGLLGTASGWFAEWRARQTAKSSEAIAIAAKKSAIDALSKVEDALRRETIAKQEADKLAKSYRQQQYVSDMNLAAQAWNENNLSRMKEILSGYSLSEPALKGLLGFEWRYLSHLALQEESHRIQLERSGRKPQFSRSGDLLTVGLSDNRVSLFEFSNNAGITSRIKRSKTIGSPHKSLWYPVDVKIMPNGREIVRVSDDTNLIELTDLNGQRLRVVASVNDAEIFKQSSLPESPEEQNLSRSFNRVNCVAVAPSGRLVAAGTTRGLLISDLEHSHRIRHIAIGDVRAVAFSHDGSKLASCQSKSVAILDLQSSESEARLNAGLGSHAQEVHFSPDDSKILVGTDDGFIQVYDTLGLIEVDRFKAHDDGIRDICFSPGKKRFATGGRDNVIRLWDWQSCELVAELRGRGSWCCFHPTENLLACASFDGQLFLWDLEGVEPNGPQVLSGYPIDLIPGETNSEFLLADSTGDYRWTPKSANLQLVNDTSNSNRIHAILRKDGCKVEFSADGTLVFARRDALAPKPIPVNDPPIDLSPSAKLLAVGEPGGSPTTWDTTTGDKLLDLPTRLVNVHYTPPAGRFSKDGTSLAVASADYSIRFFDTASGELQHVLTGHNQGVVDLDRSPTDDDRWASASWDGSVRIWDVPSGRMLHHLRHRFWVASVCFAPDGQRLASVSADRTLKIWSVQSGQQLLSVNTGMAHPREVQFSADGSCICVTAALPPSFRIFQTTSE